MPAARTYGEQRGAAFPCDRCETLGGLTEFDAQCRAALAGRGAGDRADPLSGSLAVTLAPLVRTQDLEGGYSVCFESHSADADLAGWFQGLPDNRCQVPRWGYVLEGMITFRFADREETYVAGDGLVLTH